MASVERTPHAEWGPERIRSFVGAQVLDRGGSVTVNVGGERKILNPGDECGWVTRLVESPCGKGQQWELSEVGESGDFDFEGLRRESGCDAGTGVLVAWNPPEVSLTQSHLCLRDVEVRTR